MIEYLWVAAAVAALAALAAVAAGRLAPSSASFRLPDRATLPVLLGMAALTAIVYMALSFWRYQNFYCGLWDLGIMDSAVRNMARFHGVMRDFRGPFDHFSPAMVLFVPLYWIVDISRTLLLAQSLLLAAAAVPLFYFARSRLQDATAALAVAAAYILNPYFSRVNLYDAHVECLFPLAFFLAVLALERRQAKRSCVLLNASLLIKEDFVPAIFGAGLLWLRRRGTRWVGLCAVVAAVFWAVFALKVYFPILIHVPYIHESRYPPVFGDTAAQTLQNVLAIGRSLVSGQTFRVLVSLLLPFAFLPLAAPVDSLLLCGLALLAQICSKFSHQQMFMSHYAAAMLALLPVAMVLGWAALQRATGGSPAFRRAFLAGTVAAAVACNVLFCDLPDVIYHQYIRGYNVQKQLGFLSVPFNLKRLASSPHVARVHEVCATIPREASVVAQNSLAYLFVRNKSVTKLPGPDGADVYLFDLPTHRGMEDSAAYLKRLKGLAADPRYRCVVDEDGLILFVRVAFLPAMSRQGGT